MAQGSLEFVLRRDRLVVAAALAAIAACAWGYVLWLAAGMSMPAGDGGPMNPSGMAGMGGTGRMSTLHGPTLAFLFALILIGYTIWDLDQLASLLRGLVAAVAGAGSGAMRASTCSAARVEPPQ